MGIDSFYPTIRALDPNVQKTHAFANPWPTRCVIEDVLPRFHTWYRWCAKPGTDPFTGQTCTTYLTTGAYLFYLYVSPMLKLAREHKPAIYISVIDKRDYVPQAKAEEQKRRSDSNRHAPKYTFPDDASWTIDDDGFVFFNRDGSVRSISQIDMQKFTRSKRYIRQRLFDYFTKKARRVRFPPDCLFLFDIEQEPEERVLVDTMQPETVEKYPFLTPLRSLLLKKRIHTIGEADIALVYYARAIYAQFRLPLTLFSTDSDIGMLTLVHFWDMLQDKASVFWMGYNVTIMDVYTLLHTFRALFTHADDFLFACLAHGCDYTRKCDLTAGVGLKKLWQHPVWRDSSERVRVVRRTWNLAIERWNGLLNALCAPRNIKRTPATYQRFRETFHYYKSLADHGTSPETA